MTDHQQPDHWARLASELGAAPPPEDEVQEPSVAAQASEEPEAAAPEEPRYHFSPPQRQQSPTDWVRLAMSLGAAVEEETVEALTQAAEETTSTEVVEPQAPANVPPEPPEVVMEEVETSVDVVDVLSEGDERMVDLVGQIDTEAVEETEERTTRKRRRKRKRRRPRKPEEDRDVSEETVSPFDEEAAEGEAPEEPESESESPFADTVAPSETPGRNRRRRRRRSVKKKEGKTAETSAGAAVEHSLMSVAGEGALIPLDGPEAESPQALFSDEDDQDEGEDDGESGRPLHRGIPTWEEAIGILIARNMETRAKSPGGQQRPRGRNRS